MLETLVLPLILYFGLLGLSVRFLSAPAPHAGRRYRSPAHAALGWRRASSHGSNGRRLLMRSAVGVSALLAVDLVMATQISSPPLSLIAAQCLIGFAVLVFCWNVLSIPLLTDHSFRPNPQRLFTDTLLSSLLTMLSFAQLFRSRGIQLTIGSDDPAVLDHLYFSVVTFSTLGYGDFAPLEATRLYAGFLAILGNMHLGMLVGALFYLASQKNAG
jgi:hypothetical protein